MTQRDFILLTTTETIPGRKIELIGPVFAACCLSKSALADFLANVKNWSIGGELRAYSTMLEAATSKVEEAIVDKAGELDADAVVCFRMVTSAVASGAAELIGYGTAVRIVKEEPP